MAVVRDWQTKLANAIDAAKRNERGSEYFVEQCSNPLRSTWVTTGSLKEDGSGDHDVHTRLVAEPSDYPSTPPTKDATHKEGYRRYMNRELVSFRSNPGTAFTVVPFNEWVRKFNAVTVAVDTAVRDCHAVKCYEDGYMFNKHPTNIFFLHACDVFNLYIKRLEGEVPDLFITTNSLNVLWPHSRNELTDSIMSREEIDFMVQEIDFFYCCFAYFGNFSFVPIRTIVAMNDMHFTNASFFTNNDVYREHQRGKFIQIGQDHNRMLTRVCYRTV